MLQNVFPVKDTHTHFSFLSVCSSCVLSCSSVCSVCVFCCRRVWDERTFSSTFTNSFCYTNKEMNKLTSRFIQTLYAHTNMNTQTVSLCCCCNIWRCSFRVLFSLCTCERVRENLKDVFEPLWIHIESVANVMLQIPDSVLVNNTNCELYYMLTTKTIF